MDFEWEKLLQKLFDNLDTECKISSEMSKTSPNLD